MEYNLDLGRLSVREYKDLLKQQNLLPGRRILWQDIDRIFTLFENNGIQSVADLKKIISSPKKITVFATKNCISEEYLVILKREIGSLVQKPVPLSEFNGINSSLLEKLAESGLRTSKEYWDQKPDISDELFCLCDLVRINGVGPVAARAFYEAGYQTASDIAMADAQDMLEKVSAINETNNYYKAKLGIKDMQFCIDFALLLNSYAS